MKLKHLPKILLVEDDPTVRDYLTHASEALPASVDAATDMAQALALAHARTRAYDLCLIDANLPDGTGIELLLRLRALWPEIRALAHTAAHDQAVLRSLREAGFVGVLTKPANLDRWHSAMRAALDARVLPAAATAARPTTAQVVLPLWNDAAAVRALGGSVSNLAGLRQLFLTELSTQLARIREGDAKVRLQDLHRLQASCAFVGAQRLQAVTVAFNAAPDDDQAMHVFLATARATLESARNVEGSLA